MSEIKMTEVESSTVAAVGYDPDTEVMRIQFNKGQTYELAGVPQAEYEMLMESASIGSTYAAFFKDRYDTTRLS